MRKHGIRLNSSPCALTHKQMCNDTTDAHLARVEVAAQVSPAHRKAREHVIERHYILGKGVQKAANGRVEEFGFCSLHKYSLKNHMHADFAAHRNLKEHFGPPSSYLVDPEIFNSTTTHEQERGKEAKSCQRSELNAPGIASADLNYTFMRDQCKCAANVRYFFARLTTCIDSLSMPQRENLK